MRYYFKSMCSIRCNKYAFLLSSTNAQSTVAVALRWGDSFVVVVVVAIVLFHQLYEYREFHGALQTRIVTKPSTMRHNSVIGHAKPEPMRSEFRVCVICNLLICRVYIVKCALHYLLG